MTSLTTKQVAAILGITDRQLRHLAQKGIIEAHKDKNKDWRFQQAAIDDYRKTLNDSLVALVLTRMPKQENIKRIKL